MDLEIGNGRGAKEITAVVDVIDNKVLYIHLANETINLRDDDVYLWDRPEDKGHVDMDDIQYRGRKTPVEVTYLRKIDSDDECQ